MIRYLLFGLILLSHSAYAGIIFFSGAENGWTKDRGCLNDDCWGSDETHVPYGHPYAVTQETSHNGVSPRAGNKMWKLEVRTGDSGSGGNCRNTLEQYFPMGDHEYWIGISMYFPDAFTDSFPTTESSSSYTSGSVIGLGGEDPAGGYPDGYDASTRYGMRVQSKSGDPAYLYPYQKDKIFLAGNTDQWLDFVFHFTTGSDESNDFYEYWLNGTHQGHWTGHLWPSNRLPGEVHSGVQMNYKVGQYFCAKNSDNIFYFDELRVWGGSGGSYDDVVPGGGSPTPPQLINVTIGSITTQ